MSRPLRPMSTTSAGRQLARSDIRIIKVSLALKWIAICLALPPWPTIACRRLVRGPSQSSNRIVWRLGPPDCRAALAICDL